MKELKILIVGDLESSKGWIRLLEREGIPYDINKKLKSGYPIYIISHGYEADIPDNAVGINEAPKKYPVKEGGKCSVKKINNNNENINVSLNANMINIEDVKHGQTFTKDDFYREKDFPIKFVRDNIIYLTGPLSNQLYLQNIDFKTMLQGKNENIDILTSTVDKPKIISLLKNILQETFKMRNIPYIIPWYYPEKIKTIFLFRQDIDFVVPELEDMLDLCKKYDINGTFFVNYTGEEKYEDDIGHFNLEKPDTPKYKDLLERVKDKHEIGNHGYWHAIFYDKDKDKENILKADRKLKDLLNTEIRGFSSPGGSFNSNLWEILDEIGYEYCSETCFTYGGFPFSPIFNDTKMDIFLVPFSPICPAYLAESGDNLKIFEKYYSEIIENSLESKEPITVLGHPHVMDKKIDELNIQKMFERIRNNKDIKNYTIERFLKWWRKRSESNYKIFFDDKSIKIKSKNLDLFKMEIPNEKFIQMGEKHENTSRISSIS